MCYFYLHNKALIWFLVRLSRNGRLHEREGYFQAFFGFDHAFFGCQQFLGVPENFEKLVFVIILAENFFGLNVDNESIVLLVGQKMNF